VQVIGRSVAPDFAAAEGQRLAGADVVARLGNEAEQRALRRSIDGSGGQQARGDHGQAAALEQIHGFPQVVLPETPSRRTRL